MLLMASSGFGIAQMAAANPGSIWEFIKPQFVHQDWQGCSLWDLIQPSFMFMVGMAAPFSYSKRREHGQSFFGMAWHALSRSILLVALGVMLATRGADKHTVFLFTNVLAQIGLGYFVLFLLSRMGWEYQLSAIILILAGYTWFFINHPLPSAQDLAALAGMKDAEHAILPGFAGHWNIHTNAAAAFEKYRAADRLFTLVGLDPDGDEILESAGLLRNGLADCDAAFLCNEIRVHDIDRCLEHRVEKPFKGQAGNVLHAAGIGR